MYQEWNNNDLIIHLSWRLLDNDKLHRLEDTESLCNDLFISNLSVNQQCASLYLSMCAYENSTANLPLGTTKVPWI